MSETNLSSAPLRGAASTAADGASVAALSAELAKWRERVPKLAGALRERTSEVESLRAELAARREVAAAGEPTSSGIKARDALIEELEAKVRALGGKYQDAEGQLHARDLEIGALRQEAGEWREKWQSVTATLDQQADAAAGKDQELQRLQREQDELLSLQEQHNAHVKDLDLELTALREKSRSLESRNQNLFETTELANRQIETLGENLEHLRAEVKARNEALAIREAEAEGITRQIGDLKAQIASRDQDIEFLHGHVEEKQKEIVRLEERVAGMEPLREAVAAAEKEQARLGEVLEAKDREIEALSGQLQALDDTRKSLEEAQLRLDGRDAELTAIREELSARDAALEERDAAAGSAREEIGRLEVCILQAEEATGRFETERRQISEQLEEVKRRNQHLEAQLCERSDLVVGLEQEKSEIRDRSSSLEAENKRLSEALEKAQKAAAGNADHIAQVDARLERQKQLMENLEEEFAEVQQEYADALKRHQRELNEKSAALEALTARGDADTVERLRQEVSALEAAAADARREAEASARSLAEGEHRIAELTGALDGQAALEETARLRREETEQLKEKVEKLEKQLHKQSRETALAEEAAAEARTALHELRAERDRPGDEVGDENALLQAEVIKLEGMVRERTEQLNKLRWQQDMLEKQSDDGSGSKMLMVLNQQLASAREENQRLKDQAHELEARAADGGAAADDLASIKGVGTKLVQQLAELGITRFDQIATLSESDLDDPDHPLHAMKGRILKDNWIGQAARLGGGL